MFHDIFKNAALCPRLHDFYPYILISSLPYRSDPTHLLENYIAHSSATERETQLTKWQKATPPPPPTPKKNS